MSEMEKNLDELKKLIKSTVKELDSIKEKVDGLSSAADAAAERIEELADTLVDTVNLMEHREAEGDAR